MRNLTLNDFVAMEASSRGAGSASDEYSSIESIRKSAKWKYNLFLQGESLDALFD